MTKLKLLRAAISRQKLRTYAFGIRQIHKKLILILLLFQCHEELSAYFGAKFEPPDGRIIHGVGQYVTIVRPPYKNWALVSEYQEGSKSIPLLYSVYVNTDSFLHAVAKPDLQYMVTDHGFPYILTIGLTLFEWRSLYSQGNINIPVQDLLKGKLDPQLHSIAEEMKRIPAPVFLRPGYEFGINNDGAHNDPDLGPSDFVNIWLHIFDIFDQENVKNVAWVWNTVNPQDFNYMEWYPGDQYVDWWGINFFTQDQFRAAEKFIHEAAIHEKPVMVCESCPIRNHGSQNPANWDRWFLPYFSMIKYFPHLKAFIYIHDDWIRPPGWYNFPDSRITSNELIRSNYEAEMIDSVYIHMDEYLTNAMIVGDTIPPDTVRKFTATPGDGKVILHWLNPFAHDLRGVEILRRTERFSINPHDGIKVYSGLDTFFVDLNLKNDTTYFYTSFSFDSGMNYSEPVFVSATPRNAKELLYDEKE